ncbi:MAG: hypothetical protein A3J07_00905 [Candidatus Doudnabacteria bacterium RIFCSPLOWO2_02_FULL_49_13]|uniref:Uncharacterized protein n=1 Tax=Candidatus Doudnabacteria bacterium RIFCSPHIGHO2_12_FULL_48_16 TaxID=1817838 RepID=A0A1F5PKT7_9BACT|nr:MAG: hypothetical protein A3B77_04470 [Candidatus Doudnabacteria bacterium RIFCSPHIGHO2_02_FULL_49_24]OGE89909.1 MAG: hypothetical protein A2760_04365 [Candidatus Doudnabacteria bacterium RIFCSPHIGHO2_01_FULL_50_67]OGE90310.1 MAG: hypothetical protein A3E29_04415 [Candidatus Doudnabacteria bacterium RIFCSPHIGHO2_12_FULL_48_16]OGE96738.1 MAG: hypothetical protein A2990_00405 [Candidatus Doudnabacteria bacterium RIFCSPLOWO2_01_FULL_49_40]OGF02366.1 MAG: hypothetical protein A3J07_00905 [Candid
MAQLQEQTASAQREKEAAVGRKQADLARTLTAHQGAQLEKQRVAAGIEQTKAELIQFEAVKQQAKAAGIAVEDDEGFTAAFQAEKNRLAELEQSQRELTIRINVLASDPEAVAGIKTEIEANNKKELEETETDMRMALLEFALNLRNRFIDSDHRPGDVAEEMRQALESSETLDSLTAQGEVFRQHEYNIGQDRVAIRYLELKAKAQSLRESGK